MSFQFDIGPRARAASRFIGKVKRELQNALLEEKSTRNLTQQQIATLLGVHRSVINREFMGEANLTLRRVAELVWALGWEIVFEIRKPVVARGQNQAPVSYSQAPQTGTSGGVSPIMPNIPTTATTAKAA